MKLTRQDLLNLFCSCMLLLFLLAACGGQINQQKKATSTIPANASTESAGTKICSSTPPGSSEVMRSDKRIGGEWGFTLDETADGHALGDITSSSFTIRGSRLVTTLNGYLAKDLQLYCIQLTMYWPGLEEPNKHFSYAVVGFSNRDLSPMFAFDLNHFQDYNLFAKGQYRKVPCTKGPDIKYSFDVGAKLSNGQIIYKRAPNGVHLLKRQC